MGLGHGGAVARQGVQGHARVHGGDGAHHVQVHQPLQLLPVGGGPKHQDLLVHKARLTQGLGLGDLGHGEAADALVPQQLGQGGGAHPLPVAGEHAVDGGPGGPVLDDRQVIFDGGSVDDQLAHDAALPFISVSGRGGTGPAAWIWAGTAFFGYFTTLCGKGNGTEFTVAFSGESGYNREKPGCLVTPDMRRRPQE